MIEDQTADEDLLGLERKFATGAIRSITPSIIFGILIEPGDTRRK